MPDPVVDPKPTPDPTPAPVAAPAPAPDPKPAASADPEPKPSGEPPKPAPKSEDWRDARIRQLTKQLNDERLKKGPASDPTPSPTPSETPEARQAAIDAAASEKAMQIAAETDFNRRCNEVAEAGTKEFSDFNDRMAGIRSVVNSQDPVERQQYNDLLATAIETGQGHRLLHQLGQNPGEFRKLLDMNPVKRALALATAAAKFTPPAPADDPSGAPKPITPINSSGKHYDGLKPDDPVNGTKIPLSQWMKMREQQAVERGIQ